MVRVGVCTDHPAKLKDTQDKIEEYLKKRSCWYEMEAFLGIKELLAALEGEKLDILFLEMISEKQAKAAVMLGQKEKDMKQVFLMEGKKKDFCLPEDLPFASVAAENLEEALPELIDRFFWKEHYLKRERMILSTKGRQVVIPIRELMYLERDKRLTTLVLMDGCKETSAYDLAVLQDMIGRDDFLRCHNSYVVNLNFVREFRRNEFCLSNGKDIPVSRRYLDEVRRRFKLWADSIW
ncbi:MAG TPA: response regulator transcription factor [Candidatus Limivivens merdigallinarum]|uniref:Response regulator transcription factor n=1 Tax=Candidatus Limivivens merdigallinarum TaxID=2840859 RepID=A0A9D0ZSH1_9FIRM|nr:response regulator transcription factor [Candidatus Limivivens merdigallinarum]